MKKSFILSMAILGGVSSATAAPLGQNGTNGRTPSQMPLQTPQTPSQTQSEANSRLNSRPQNGAIQTLDVSQKIREDLTARRDLSPQAQNIAIVQSNGNVFLRGMVESEDEKRMVEDLAKRSAMNATIVNELTISPQKLLDAPGKELPVDTE